MHIPINLDTLFKAHGIENDGFVDFIWLPQSSALPLPDIPDSCNVLEIRLGYPEADPDKTFSLRVASSQTAFYKTSIRKGWNSYFVDISEDTSNEQSLIIEFNKGLDAPQDNRFLGAMLSYGFISGAHPYRQQIASLNQSIDRCIAAAKASPEAFDIRSYLNRLVTSDEAVFYDEHVLAPISADQIRKGIGRYSVLSKREIWLERHIRPDTKVLEIGCGLGGLSFLADRGVEVHGIDLSAVNVAVAKAAGYKEARQASATSIPYPDQYFDYVVSLDVFGHIAFSDKSKVLCELDRVLKSKGEMLHGIEVDNFNPDDMDISDFARMVLIDGHIGIETREAVINRFSDQYTIEEQFLVGNSCMSADHWIRAHYLYGTNLPTKLIAYLLNLSPSEKEAFDVGVGTTFWQLYNEGYDSKGTGGLYFIRALKSH